MAGEEKEHCCVVSRQYRIGAIASRNERPPQADILFPSAVAVLLSSNFGSATIGGVAMAGTSFRPPPSYSTLGT